MAYFSKHTILEAYKNLGTLSSDPSSQGATQRVSAIRYFIALDMFYKQYNRECDTTDAEDAASFIKLVGKVVAINKDCYTSNFYKSIGTNGDYSVGSNFYSVNVVSLSKNNIKEKYHFPRRGDSPLIDVAAGKLYENPDYIHNFKSYVSDSHRIPLIIWLLRDTDLNDNDACQSIIEQLQCILTPSLSQILCPTREELSSYIHEDSICHTVSQLSKEDILGLFKEPLNMVNYNDHINLLLKKHNVILTGAPGTGKTFTAKAMAADIISDGKCDWNSLTEEQKKQVAFVQFHPSYDYTDFIEGLRPVSGGEFRRQDGVFKAFCKRAATDSPNPYIFIIDEINRGELSKIFGELFYAIEPDYRGKAGMVQTQYNNLVEEDDVFKAGFYIPENVYIIGTMNDVDRGVEAMDFAIRRRFAWIEVTAEESAENMGITGLALKKMEALNTALMTNGLSRAYCIGGAYFRKLENDDYDSLWKYHLEGIVYEYFRGEPDAEEKLQAVKKAYEEAELPTTSEPIEGKEAVPAE